MLHLARRSLDKLIDDALFFRRYDDHGSCLFANKAAIELGQCPEEALSRIEQVISEVVAPVFESADDHAFVGLTSFLGAYLLIGSRSDPARVVVFIRKLPAKLQAEAVATVPIFFSRSNQKSQHETLINDVLLAYVYDSTRSESTILREKACRALTFLSE